MREWCYHFNFNFNSKKQLPQACNKLLTKQREYGIHAPFYTGLQGSKFNLQT